MDATYSSRLFATHISGLTLLAPMLAFDLDKLILYASQAALIASFVILMSIISFCAVLLLREYTGHSPAERSRTGKV